LSYGNKLISKQPLIFQHPSPASTSNDDKPHSQALQPSNFLQHY
jgi:hypothetical protein